MIKHESIVFYDDKHLGVHNLAIKRNEIKRILCTRNERDIDYWQNKILDLANKGILENDEKSLTRYLGGIANGWVRPCD